MGQYVTSWENVPVLVDLPFVAALFGVSHERARTLCTSGTIPAFKVGGMWRVNKRELMRFCGEKEEDTNEENK